MATIGAVVEPSTPIDPDTILQRSFGSVRRGYDPLEVQKFLMALAGDLRASRERERDLERRLSEAERTVAELSEMSPARLTALLGEETTRVLNAANAAAEDIRLKAEENVARLLREGQDEVARLRREAEQVLDRKTREAEEVAGGIVRQGEEALQQARAEAEKEIEAGRQRGREMVGEAQRVRERMLRDLARRRKLLRQQIEQLQAGRERLMAAYDVVRETLETATGELEVSLPEARTAAEEAGAQFDDAMKETLEQDLAELTAEVEAGLTLPAIEVEEPVEEVEAADAAPLGTDATEPLPARGGEPEPTAAAAPEPEPAEPDVELEEETPEPAAASGSAEPEPKAPDPVEGRRSSAVNVIRQKGAKGEPDADGAPASSGEKVANIFARIKEEADEPAEAAPGTTVLTGSGGTPAESQDEGHGDGEPTSITGRRDQLIADVERNLARRLKRELSDEQNEVLDAVRREKRVPQFDAVFPDPEDHVERYAGAALPMLADAATAGSEFIGTKPKGSGGARVGDVAAEVGAEIVGPLRERLESCFVEAGGEADDLSERLRAQYREWKNQRIDGLSSYSVSAAFNRGVLNGCEDGTKVHWVVDDGGASSAPCEENAQAGNVTRGEPFPSGHLAPPTHPTCRCLVVPVGFDA